MLLLSKRMLSKADSSGDDALSNGELWEMLDDKWTRIDKASLSLTRS